MVVPQSLPRAWADFGLPPRRGDLWGGFAAMLVALPAAIGFGVAVFSAIGPAHAVHGAFAGIVGTVVIGCVASLFGGTARLVSAPCAPAAAVLSAFALEMAAGGDAPETIALMLVMIGVLAGLIQVALGFIGVGRLIKYIPYPVVSGYLTGVGLIIIGSQLPKLLGLTAAGSWWGSLVAPAAWDWRAIAIGAVTAGVVLAGTRRSWRLPGAIVGIGAGIAVYAMLALADPALRTLQDNTLVLGPLGATVGGFVDAFVERWGHIGQTRARDLLGLAGSAVTLAALLSIDTLKTCVVVDRLTHSRHDSDRELIAQGLANVASSACGGISGAGTMGPTLVALKSGAETRATGLVQALFALVAALILGSFVAWVPVAALAGILIAIGWLMIDREALRLARSRTTVLDFCVVAAVVAAAVTVGLIAASAVGVLLAMVLFVREQSRASVVRHRLGLAQAPSTWHRPSAELEVLRQRSAEAVIFELQGSLFFGNTYKLNADLEQEVQRRRFVIVDLKRVRSVDVTAVQAFAQMIDAMRARDARLLLCAAPGQRQEPALCSLFEQLSLLDPAGKTVRLFPDLDGAIAYVEERLLRGSELTALDEAPLGLRQMEMFAGYSDETLADLEAAMQVRRCAPGDVIYAAGSPGEELYWVRCGAVRLISPAGDTSPRQVAGFGRGDYFGGLAFLDNEPRPNDAVAVTATEVYVLSRSDFEAIARKHHKLAFNITATVARTLAMRLRRTQIQLAALQEN
ncbi:MAG: SulP family inorganic anion transporter [Rubrivivax sp.]